MVLQTIKHRGSGFHKWKWNSQNLHKYSQGNIAVHFLQPCYHPNLLQKDGWLVDLHTSALLLFLSCSLFFLEPDFNWWHYYKENVFSCHLFFGPKEISQIMYDLQSVFPQFQSGHVRTRSLFLSGEQHGAEGSGSSKSFRAPLGSVGWPGSSSSEKNKSNQAASISHGSVFIPPAPCSRDWEGGRKFWRMFWFFSVNLRRTRHKLEHERNEMFTWSWNFDVPMCPSAGVYEPKLHGHSKKDSLPTVDFFPRRTQMF